MTSLIKTFIGERELDALAIGANILGSGGGGDPAYDLLIAKETIRTWGPVLLISLDELDAQSWVAPIGYMGAPLVCLEKIPSGREFPLIIQELAKQKKHISALLPFEIGGSNAFAPFCAAGQLGLPVIDADTFGRAFPEMNMSVCELAGICPSPAIIVDNHDQYAIVHAQDGKSMERQLRALTTSMGASAAVCTYPMQGMLAKEFLIKGSISLAIQMGQAFIEAKEKGAFSPSEILKQWGGKLLCEGTIVDIDSSLQDSFLKGVVCLEKETQQWTIHYQNEFLAIEDAHHAFLATTPDIIVVFDSDSGLPVPVERLAFGLQVSVCALPAPCVWQTSEGLALVGPRIFGFPCDYQPILLKD
jgi:DUF917 family protein